jgi:hypothetical protein
MNEIKLKRGNAAVIPLEIWDTTTDPESAYNLTGLTVFISVKKINDSSNDDSLALITSKITSHSAPTLGLTNWTLTKAQTLVHPGKYRADIKIYSGSLELNSDIFYVEIEDTVTKRTI